MLCLLYMRCACVVHVWGMCGAQDKESMMRLIRVIDKANGYAFAGIEMSAVEYSKIAAGASATDLER